LQKEHLRPGEWFPYKNTEFAFMVKKGENGKYGMLFLWKLHLLVFPEQIRCKKDLSFYVGFVSELGTVQ